MNIKGKFRVDSHTKDFLKAQCEIEKAYYECSFGSYMEKKGDTYRQITSGGNLWKMNFSHKGHIIVSFVGKRNSALSYNNIGWVFKSYNPSNPDDFQVRFLWSIGSQTADVDICLDGKVLEYQSSAEYDGEVFGFEDNPYWGRTASGIKAVKIWPQLMEEFLEHTKTFDEVVKEMGISIDGEYHDVMPDLNLILVK